MDARYKKNIKKSDNSTGRKFPWKSPGNGRASRRDAVSCAFSSKDLRLVSWARGFAPEGRPGPARGWAVLKVYIHNSTYAIIYYIINDCITYIIYMYTLVYHIYIYIYHIYIYIYMCIVYRYFSSNTAFLFMCCVVCTNNYDVLYKVGIQWITNKWYEDLTQPWVFS